MGLKKKVMKTAGVAAASRIASKQGDNLARAAEWASDRVRPRRKRNVMGITAAKGLGAAALALPIGLWLGRRRRSEAEM